MTLTYHMCTFLIIINFLNAFKNNLSLYTLKHVKFSAFFFNLFSQLKSILYNLLDLSKFEVCTIFYILVIYLFFFFILVLQNLF